MRTTMTLPHRKEELADLIYLKAGKNPTLVRTQALLVIAEFEDGSMGVWRIEELEAMFQ